MSKTSHKCYPKYKPSGIEWLGDVPEHWEARKLKYLVDLLTQKIDSDETKLGLENIESWTGQYLKTESEFDGDGVPFEVGDVLYGKLRPYLAKVFLAEQDGLAVGDFFVLRPEDIVSKYLQYKLLEPIFTNLSDGSTFGAKMPRVSWNFMGDLKFSLPDVSEQKAIAAYLDEQTRRIDGLVSAKRRQIELLKEKRSALITNVVTKGLNPNAKLKPSGIDWLGDVPEHWETIKLRHLLDGTLVNGLFKKKDAFGSGYKLINVFDVYQETYLVDNTQLERVEATETEYEKYSVESGDIFFVRSSLKLEGVGRSVCAIKINEPTVFECHIVRARPNQKRLIPTFLIDYLNSSLPNQHIVALANCVTMATISQDTIKDFPICVPPLSEQKAIAEYLDEQTGRIDTIIAKVEQSIELLQEYRTAIISAAVTGQIDVREAV